MSSEVHTNQPIDGEENATKGSEDTSVGGPSSTSKLVTATVDRLYLSSESTLSALFETIIVSAAPMVDRLLSDNPQVIRAKGFHGLSLLHKASMRGDTDVISIILRHGADPNARTDAGETPLHYGCRQGRLPVLATLIRGSADPNATDNSGHSCLHFAAQGGSTTILAFLNEVHGADYGALSLAEQSPLHVAAIHGHWQTAAFLLRKERCCVSQADIMGNTALHLAACYGHMPICWQIVTSRNGALGLVATNGQRQTPVDLARMSNTNRHKETQEWLAKMVDRYKGKREISPPTTMQYFNFFFPTVLCCLPLLASPWFAPGAQLLMYVVVLCIVARWIVQQDHRLKHPSRLPNPARAGIFAFGFVGNLVCYFLILRPYELFDWVVNWMTWTSLFAFIVSLLTFLTKNPGRYRYETTTLSSGGRDWTPVANGEFGANFCDECELIQKEGIRHCRMCRSCYHSLQHHCLFLLRCVTASNASQFLFVLVSVICGCLSYVVNVILYVTNEQLGKPAMIFWTLLLEDTLVHVMVAIDVCAIVTCLVMVQHQLKNPNKWPVSSHAHGKVTAV